VTRPVSGSCTVVGVKTPSKASCSPAASGTLMTQVDRNVAPCGRHTTVCSSRLPSTSVTTTFGA
jgi:hypothetical protein